MRRLCIIALIVCTFNIHAWSSLGHRVSAYIAFEALNAKERRALYQLMFPRASVYLESEARHRFVSMSVYPDTIKHRDNRLFDNWHYISLSSRKPFNADAIKWQKDNVIWATLNLYQMLNSNKTKEQEKRWALPFYIHFIADLHQPLHVMTLCNQQFKYCDKGGNRYRIRNRYDNLHWYWDMGGGLLAFKPKIKRSTQVARLAKRITEKYPYRTLLKANDFDFFPIEWAKAVYNIAKKNVYTISFNASPSPQYQRQVQSITEHQLALSGYRLAESLKPLLQRDD